MNLKVCKVFGRKVKIHRVLQWRDINRITAHDVGIVLASDRYIFEVRNNVINSVSIDPYIFCCPSDLIFLFRKMLQSYRILDEEILLKQSCLERC